MQTAIRTVFGLHSSLSWSAKLRTLGNNRRLDVCGDMKQGNSVGRLARLLAARFEASLDPELAAPALNIVCFRYRWAVDDSIKADIVADLQESGAAVPSTATVNGRVAIRVAIANPRTLEHDALALLDAVCEFGARGSAALSTLREAA